MKQVPITQAGAMILDSKYRIPEMAKASLDKFANNRFKELKYVTKAFKYQFPFYESMQKKRSFNKIFQVMDNALERMIPYLSTAKVKFLSTDRDSSDSVWVRLGPITATAADTKKRKSLERYLNRLNRMMVRQGIPLNLAYHLINYTKPTRHRYAYYESETERLNNTYQVFEIRVVFRAGIGENGYLLLFFAPQILKVLETLHRHAHYADSTFSTHR